MTDTPTLLTMTEAARLARVSKSHLSKLTRGLVRGVPPLPVVRLGRRVLIRTDALLSWLSERCSGSVVH
jgi:excisionase family DNA binding protein